MKVKKRGEKGEKKVNQGERENLKRQHKRREEGKV